MEAPRHKLLVVSTRTCRCRDSRYGPCRNASTPRPTSATDGSSACGLLNSPWQQRRVVRPVEGWLRARSHCGQNVTLDILHTRQDRLLTRDRIDEMEIEAFTLGGSQDDRAHLRARLRLPEEVDGLQELSVLLLDLVLGIPTQVDELGQPSWGILE
jgi:hypothetical protein